MGLRDRRDRSFYAAATDAPDDDHELHFYGIDDGPWPLSRMTSGPATVHPQRRRGSQREPSGSAHPTGQAPKTGPSVAAVVEWPR
jgi:hypothetical protein